MSRYIGTLEWAMSNHRRALGVRRIPGVMLTWCAMDDRGRILPMGDYIARFDTHAEAIAFAHEHATRQALAASFTIPPENPAARAMKEKTC